MFNPTIQATGSDCAYAAGFLDGEGAISILLESPKSLRQKRRIQLRVSIANTDLPTLLWLRDRWGGSISNKHVVADHPRWKQAFCWVVASRKAAAFLTDVQPYVKLKAPQLNNGLAYQATKKPTPRGTWGRLTKLTDEQWAEADSYLEKQRALNMRGVKE